jgi:hypothetical protein
VLVYCTVISFFNFVNWMLTFYRYADACLASESHDRSSCQLLVLLWPQFAFHGTFPCLDSSATFFLASLRLASSHSGGTRGPLNQGGEVLLVRWKLLATELYNCSEDNSPFWFRIISERHFESTNSMAHYLGVCSLGRPCLILNIWRLKLPAYFMYEESAVQVLPWTSSSRFE